MEEKEKEMGKKQKMTEKKINIFENVALDYDRYFVGITRRSEDDLVQATTLAGLDFRGRIRISVFCYPSLTFDSKYRQVGLHHAFLYMYA
uniref:Uncharacterized protein n=1 Tax=Octopus bimaculoides TaxID=37653 RepID=A0A0L8GTR5_OCTBM